MHYIDVAVKKRQLWHERKMNTETGEGALIASTILWRAELTSLSIGWSINLVVHVTGVVPTTTRPFPERDRGIKPTVLLANPAQPISQPDPTSSVILPQPTILASSVAKETLMIDIHLGYS